MTHGRQVRPRVLVRAHHVAQRGFTLIESMIASVVVAASVIAISTALNFAYANSARLDDDEAAVALARQLMEQLASLPFRNNTAARDSILDYNGYSDTFSPTGSSRNGATVPAGSGRPYQRQVSVSFRQVPTPQNANAATTTLLPSAEDTGVAVVVVTITTSNGRTVQLSQLFTDAMTE